MLVVAVVAGGLAFAGRGGSSALGPPRFVDDAPTSGLEHAYTGEYPYVVGGGVATFDCDDDGRPDLYLAGGERPAQLFRNVSERGGALRFEAVPSDTTDLDAVTGAYPLDIDGDGIVDLAVLRLGENVILRGLGDCAFERANEALGFDGGHDWTTAFSATWEDETTLPTLAFGEYLGLDATGEPTTTCADSSLVRPSPTARPTARRSPCRRAGARSRSCSATGIDPGVATCGSATIATTTATARSSSGGSSRARPPRPYTAEDGWKPGSSSGGWASPART